MTDPIINIKFRKFYVTLFFTHFDWLKILIIQSDGFKN